MLTSHKLGRRGTTLMIDWPEILVALILIIVGILLIFAVAKYQQSRAESKTEDALKQVHKDREIVQAFTQPFDSTTPGVAVADQVIFSRHDIFAEDALKKHPIMKRIFVQGKGQTNLILPDLGGSVITITYTTGEESAEQTIEEAAAIASGP
jgi:hypothetical protein